MKRTYLPILPPFREHGQLWLDDPTKGDLKVIKSDFFAPHSHFAASFALFKAFSNSWLGSQSFYAYGSTS